MEERCFNRALVAVNNSDATERVIHKIEQMVARNILGDICVIAIWNYYKVDYSKRNANDKERILKQKAQMLLKCYEEKLKSKGIEVKTLLLAGDPADSILKEAQKGGYDLIIMERRRLNRIQETLHLIASCVTDKVIRLSKIPVLII